MTQDWFVIARESALTSIRVGAAAERIVDIWHTLSVHLDPAVDVHIEDVRSRRCWTGTFLALPEVREAAGRLRLPLAAYGGVELSLFTGDDQLTLTPEMVLVLYARNDRWAFLLDGMGLRECATLPNPSWVPRRHHLRAVPQLEQALQSAADRLGLVETGSDE